MVVLWNHEIHEKVWDGIGFRNHGMRGRGGWKRTTEYAERTEGMGRDGIAV